MMGENQSDDPELNQFLGASLRLEIFILHWRKAVSEWSSADESEHQHGALYGWELIKQIDREIDTIFGRVLDWRERIAACDPAGSTATFKADARSWPTAHEAVVDYFRNSLISLGVLMDSTGAATSKEMPPTELMAWMTERMLPGGSDLICRLVRERGRVGAELATAKGIRRRRINRRPSASPNQRLTERQLEAHHLYGERHGNMTEVAKLMGISRQVAQEHYDAALKKLGRVAIPKAKTRRLTSDHLGMGVDTNSGKE